MLTCYRVVICKAKGGRVCGFRGWVVVWFVGGVCFLVSALAVVG